MINVVVLMGRLVADPELKQTANGASVTSFRIAVDRNFANKETGERQADFINIVAWRQTADFVCKYFRKGSMIAIEGSLQTRSYEDKDGNKRTAYEVVASNVSFTGSKAESGTAPRDNVASFEVPATAFSAGSNGDFEVVNEQDDDDLPF
ncbi:MAG: single-stranded DNA-binding protein [Oscillospiraceae bacterium]|nr:single-stranded DNA-binding protein [Oscillospiraceae bacterium]